MTESMRGEIVLRVFQVRDNRMSSCVEKIDVPWSNKELGITWEHFTSKLAPGGRETWTARITGPNAKRATAEFCAGLYDASLDQFAPHKWSDFSHLFEYRRELFNDEYEHDWGFSNENIRLDWVIDHQKIAFHPAPKAGALYRQWNDQFAMGDVHTGAVMLEYYSLGSRTVMADVGGQSGDDVVRLSAFRVTSNTASASAKPARPTPEQTLIGRVRSEDKMPKSQSAIDLAEVTARKNLNETAFFFPQLLTDSDGSVRMEFTVPEALTRWKFLGFAHDKQLRSAVLTDTAVTAKALMVQPNPPRFLREGDTVEFTVKITNTTDKPQTGVAQLTFADASSLAAVDLFSAQAQAKRDFTLDPTSSRTLSWRITIPDGQGFLTYKAVASTGTVGDGEEGFLPVLSRRQLVTESIALPIRDAGTRAFTFDKLAAFATDTTIRNESLTVQMTSNPAWYAVLALPGLMEYPHECSEQLFNRYYANALAAHIAKTDPKIARVFEQWRNTPALDSPLLKNEDLKSVLIEETPWLRQASSESEQRRAIGQLFNANHTTAQTDDILRTLSERQLSDGRWAWFPGGNGSEYITRYLVVGFARLRHFGIKLDSRADTMLKRAITELDASFAARHADLIVSPIFSPTRDYVGTSHVYQLYARSFFLGEIPIPDSARASYDYFIGQTRDHWQKLPRQSQGHAALALARTGDATTAAAIVTSLKQRAKNHDESGMYWADADRGWFWWQAPVETHALMIEVFDEVAHDAQAVADLQLWLLKQKQTHAWSSTKATADAVYALLLRGTDKLASDALVTVQLGSEKITPENTEAGTGFYSQRIPGASVTPEMGGKITVTKIDAGPAWGSVTWQYFQSVDKITPHGGTPLTLRKTLWKQINTGGGPTLVSLGKTKLEPGDTLVVRIELHTDREMEFVHLKDQRGSGAEPVNVLSGYRWKNGLGYYESTRDTASHFFMDRLPAGAHVFEYPIRVQLRGKYESGIAEVQCMYAPEYNSRGAGTTLVVE